MGYVTSIPPAAYIPGVGSYPTVWVYKSADDDGTVNGANYISNASDLGMKVNDIVLVIDTTTPKVSLHSVSAISAAGAATLIFGAVA